MLSQNLELGKSGEDAAVNFLIKQDYRILFRNYRTKLGEIDIVARDKDTVCFVEVKSRQSDRCGLPSESVIAAKQRRISRLAILFLKENNLLNARARFDVVSVVFSGGLPEIELVRNAFELNGSFTY